MDSAALFGLLGALVGGGPTMLGSLLTTRQQDRLQRQRAARERREEAYASTIRHLLRAMNRRSSLQVQADGSVVAFLDKESMPEFFEDLVEGTVLAGSHDDRVFSPRAGRHRNCTRTAGRFRLKICQWEGAFPEAGCSTIRDRGRLQRGACGCPQ